MNRPLVNHPEHAITEPTRRKIADELTLNEIEPNGELDEVAFFSRIFDLQKLPTRDTRVGQFPNMTADLRQHRVNNPMDWPDGWWWTDDRIALLHAPDETFLRFLAEMVHPIVRPDPAEREALLEIFNRHLASEGWEIRPVTQVGAHPIYGGRRLEQLLPTVTAEARELAETLGDYVARQITRMETAVSGDPDLAIGTAKEFIETICRTILKDRGVVIPQTVNLPGLVRLAVNSLPVVPEGVSNHARWNDVVVRLVNNLASLGQSLAELRNAFGTGHGRSAGHIGLERHHAELAVRTTTAAGVFLYQVHERNPVRGTASCAET